MSQTTILEIFMLILIRILEWKALQFSDGIQHQGD